jgi:hypothetical protein
VQIFKKEIPPQVIRLSLLALLIICITSFKIITANIIKIKIDKILGNAKEYVSYRDASMDLFGFDVHIDDIKVSFPGQKPLLIDEMIVKSFDEENALPRYMNIKIKGMQSDLATLKMNPAFAKTIDGLELQDIQLELVMNYKYDKEQKMLDVKEMTLDVDDLAKITYTTQIHNVVAMEYFLMQLNLAPQTLRFGPTNIKIENDSFVERFMKMNAKDANLSVDTYKTELFAKEQKLIDEEKSASKSIQASLDESWLNFLKNPKSFELETKPIQPMPLLFSGDDKAKNDLFSKLNLKATAN